MKRVLKVKPSRFQSLICFIAGCIFFLVGCFVVIPKAGLFGYVWTLFALLLTITQGVNAFTKKGAATQTLEIEDSIEEDMINETFSDDEVEKRLRKLKDLYEKNLITREEYQKKKAEILDNY